MIPWASKKHSPCLKNDPGHPKNIVPISKTTVGIQKNIIPISKTTLGIQKSRSPSQQRPWESKRDPPSHKKPDIKKTFSRPKNDSVHPKGNSPAHKKTLRPPRPRGGILDAHGAFLERGICFLDAHGRFLERGVSFLDAQGRF